MLTERLEVRLPVEADRSRLVELFGDDEFMVFAGGTLDHDAANRRFDGMLERAAEYPFAKQPVIERTSGTILGYTGVNTFDLDGERWLEFGWRLVPSARGKGYATEAAGAVIDIAERCFEGTLLAMIDPANKPSQNVARKVGFVHWRDTHIEGDATKLYRLALPRL